jgi:flagellar export protein FliJ
MAKRFKFRLEVVRKLREQARDVQRRMVVESVNAVSRVTERVGRFTDELRETVELNREQRESARVDVSSLRVGEFYRNWLHHRILDGTLQLTQEQIRLQAEREKLGRVSAQLKAVEKLKERRHTRYRWEVSREEQAQMDESALQTYAHRTSESAP